MFPPLLTKSCLLAWVMLNGPCQCNRLTAWVPKLNTKKTSYSQAEWEILWKREKSAYVIYIQTETISAICSISKLTNLVKCFKLKSNLHVETVCLHTGIWPTQLFKVEQIYIALWAMWHRLYSRGGNHKYRMRNPSTTEQREEDSSRIKRPLLRAPWNRGALLGQTSMHLRHTDTYDQPNPLVF